MARKATSQDVADLAGVSRSAVSLVLNGRAQGHIPRHKQQAIIEAARRLNYTPNAVALSLRSRRTRTIGVLTWPGAGGFSVRMLHATLESATASGYLMILWIPLTIMIIKVGRWRHSMIVRWMPCWSWHPT